MATINELLSEKSKVKESNVYTATDRREAVKLRLTKDGDASLEPKSILSLFYETATKYPNTPALCYKDFNKTWQTVTYR